VRSPVPALVTTSSSPAAARLHHRNIVTLYDAAFQVAENGDLANWARSEDDNAPAIGGAMDLAAGARRVLSSHWNVDDASTAELMGQFFDVDSTVPHDSQWKWACASRLGQ
jgi:acyl CoA:acetate/3-ketoacid CoA transferase beta subunit